MAPEPVFTAAENPYKGLRAFEESDADEFFGRDALVDGADRGAPGAQARRGRRAVGHRQVVGGQGRADPRAPGWRGCPAPRAGWSPRCSPARIPFEELAAALVRVAVERRRRLVDELSRDALGLRRVTKQVLPADSGLVLVVDQFEELFTLTADDESAGGSSTGSRLSSTTPARASASS